MLRLDKALEAEDYILRTLVLSADSKNPLDRYENKQGNTAKAGYAKANFAGQHN